MSTTDLRYLLLSIEPLPGVYRIVNNETGSFYAGSSLNVLARLKTHLHGLRRGAHHCQRLLRSWSKHGSDKFKFEIIDYCLAEDLLVLEQAVLDQYWGTGKLYNAVKVARLNSAAVRARIAAAKTGFRHSLASRAKMSVACKGRQVSGETRAKLSEVNQRHNLSPETLAGRSAALTGLRHSLETRARLSASAKLRKSSAETCAKISAANKGLVRSPEARARISAAKKGHAVSPETRAKISKTKRLFRSQYSCADLQHASKSGFVQLGALVLVSRFVAIQAYKYSASS